MASKSIHDSSDDDHEPICYTNANDVTNATDAVTLPDNAKPSRLHLTVRSLSSLDSRSQHENLLSSIAATDGTNVDLQLAISKSHDANATTINVPSRNDASVSPD